MVSEQTVSLLERKTNFRETTMSGMSSKTKVVLILTAVMILASGVIAFAMMSSGMMGGGSMMTTTGGFGMMDGTAGGPIVGTDGTAYLASMMPSATPGSTPTSNSFLSHMMAISSTGQTLKLSVSGIMSKPVFANGITFDGITGNFMMATVSLPNLSNYSMMHNYATSTTGHSVLYWMQRPFTTSSMPVAVAMDGAYASQPVIANNMIYVTTTNNGNAMMQGNNVFHNTFPSYSTTSSTSYLHVFRMDGTLVSKTQLQ